jgi:hypothetical protein
LPVRITQANRSDMAMRQRGILHGADQSADHHLQRLVSLVPRSHSAARWIAAGEAEEIQAPFFGYFDMRMPDIVDTAAARRETIGVSVSSSIIRRRAG